MTTMDNRVGEGQGGVAATYRIHFHVVLYQRLLWLHSRKDVTVRRAYLTQ
jgi:hypothetical protein